MGMHELATVLLLRLLWRRRLCVCVCVCVYNCAAVAAEREGREGREGRERVKRGERGEGRGEGGVRDRGRAEGTPLTHFFSSPPEYVCVHLHTQIQCIHANKNVYVYTYMHRDICTHKYNMIFMYVYTYVCAHVHTQI